MWRQHMINKAEHEYTLADKAVMYASLVGAIVCFLVIAFYPQGGAA